MRYIENILRENENLKKISIIGNNVDEKINKRLEVIKTIMEINLNSRISTEIIEEVKSIQLLWENINLN